MKKIRQGNTRFRNGRNVEKKRKSARNEIAKKKRNEKQRKARRKHEKRN